MKLLSPHDVAQILDINYRKVLQLIHVKELPAIKIIRQFKIAESDLYSYIDNNRI